jgi:hypothetical protein
MPTPAPASRQKTLHAYPMLTGSACITSQTIAKMMTLQAVAAIPAVMASSMPWLGRRNDATVIS